MLYLTNCSFLISGFLARFSPKNFSSVLTSSSFRGDGQDLVYHRAEGVLSHVTVLVCIVVKEGLKDVPEELRVLWGPSLNGLGDESLELVLGTSVEDGVGIKGGNLGLDVLQAELKPLIKSDDPRVLQVHHVEHLVASLGLLSVRGKSSCTLGDEPSDQSEE